MPALNSQSTLKPIEFPNGKRYRDLRSFYQETFGERVQKISIDYGFTCPNRDGSKAKEGCTYCNNATFKPFYTTPEKTITQQLEEGVAFFSKKYKAIKFLAYFQSYTNTYSDIDHLRKLYKEALSVPGVIGLVVGTRPDCISEEIAEMFVEINKTHFVSIELGIESTLNRTLESINRCQTYEETIAAFELCASKGLHVGGHMILGLPGESREDLLDHARKISKLPIQSLKLHHLQIVKHTRMAIQWKQTPEMFDLFTADDYISLLGDFIGLIRPDIVIDRFINESPPDKLLAPKWDSLKNFEVLAKVEKSLEKRNLWQGKHCEPAKASV
ncbi:MAG: radical SAM protein (TIGR01212 family) [Granulosicoccus sp.]|jgi:radical SAM protein (TIGR01212 family)